MKKNIKSTKIIFIASIVTTIIVISFYVFLAIKSVQLLNILTK